MVNHILAEAVEALPYQVQELLNLKIGVSKLIDRVFQPNFMVSNPNFGVRNPIPGVVNLKDGVR